MISLREFLRQSPAFVRVAPFAVFIALTACQGQFGEASRYWFYLAKTLAAIGMLIVVRPFIEEMRWRISWEAVAAGCFVFVIWVGLDGLYPRIGESSDWNPHTEFGRGSALALFFIFVRISGSTLVVPLLEEVFYRSFLYRYLIQADFKAVPFGRVQRTPLLIAAVIFGFTHSEWLPGILCGLIYQWLVFWKGRLGDAIAAHALTNFLLGVWVVGREAWHFW